MDPLKMHLEANPDVHTQPGAARRHGRALRTAASLSLLLGLPSPGEPVPVPNGSFESPAITFADPRIDVWIKSPKPVWYDESGGFTWDQLTGIFDNPPEGSADYKIGADGEQAGFLSAVPEVALSQELPSTVFEPGRTYTLTVGLVGGGGGMVPGVSLELAFFYRTTEGTVATVASTTVTHDLTVFPDRTRFRDFNLATPPVTAGDAWAGKPVGIRLASTVRPDLAGGYWDIENVRLDRSASAGDAPSLRNPARSGNGFTFEIVSRPGAKLEVLSTTQVQAAGSTWDVVGAVTNATGTLTFEHADPGAGPRFYQARVVP